MDLNDNQIKAINHIEGPALILAVPGAGKTTVIINRTANLIINHRTSPERILSITFSRASANDMKARFNKEFPNISSIPVHFSTIHSFCFGLIKEYAYTNKIKYTLIEDSRNQLNKYSLLKKIYFDINNKHITEEKLEILLNSIGYIKNMMISPRKFLEDNRIDIENFTSIYNSYEKFKKDNLLLDFDDMLTTSLDILSSDRYMLDKYRNKYDFVQVDEGQDTSKVQLEIIKTLASPRNNLFIVADDDQSIYGFRGAYPQGLFQFSQIYKDAKLFFMEENYRSSKNIVAVSNKFIKKNTLRYIKNISTKNRFFQPVNIVKVYSIDDQYSYIINDLKNKNLSDSCILYRNNLSAIGIIEVFERKKIPFHIRDARHRFFNHWLLQDIINFIRFSQDTSNIELYEGIYYKKKGYISKKQINYAKSLNYTLSVFNRIADYPGIPDYYQRTLDELKIDFQTLSRLCPIDAIRFIEYNLEYEKYLKSHSMRLGYTYDTLKVILYYLKLIAKKCDSLNDLLDRLNKLEYLCYNSKSDQAITLSTVHSAKGLEFSNVYIIDLVDEDFPTVSSIEAFQNGNLQLLEEERRLFYVGITRAKHFLTLITMDSMGNRLVKPSRFLSELEV